LYTPPTEFSQPHARPLSLAIDMMNADQLLDRHFLEVRARLLDIAAMLDRIERAKSDNANDDRLQQLKAGLEILLSEQNHETPNRAERIQHHFSLDYHPRWRDDFGI
jgi:hypothetical protein